MTAGALLVRNAEEVIEKVVGYEKHWAASPASVFK
jgi:hypothetical protein